ncbi:helix-turn-helix domain-containing protein [Streptomyces sp. NPDC014882]|uniref:helix-turn-helix domain-containing protein n=1 Tax=Streptomyces sp. NPDC014882 TaxID=3364927 RepID=UPI0036F95BCE
MSKDVREWVFNYSSSRGTARLVLLAVADRVPDERCVVWASVADLMKRTNASRTAVRDALAALDKSGELVERGHLQGPKRSSVYRLPRAASWLAKVAAVRHEDPDAYVEPPTDSDPVPDLDADAEKGLQRYGIWPRRSADSDPSRRNPTGSDSTSSRRNPTRRRAGIRTPHGTDSNPQNPSERDLNRRYSSSGAAVVPAGEWQVDPATHAWARQQGHLDRLGEEGLKAADAKWRLHRSDWTPRSAGAWSTDWRAWITREHPPARRGLHAVPDNSHRPPHGMTRTEAHQAALLRALDEPTGTEG